MKPLLSLAILAALSFPSTSQGQRTEKDGIIYNVDRFEGYSSVTTNAEKLDGGGLFMSTLSIRFQRFTAKDSSTSHQIFINYLGDDWLFIEEGESVAMLIDGEPVKLASVTGSRDRRDVLGGGRVSESAMYEVELPLLLRIANAQKVEMKISGSKVYVERSMSKNAFKRLRQFLVTTGVPSDSLLKR